MFNFQKIKPIKKSLSIIKNLLTINPYSRPKISSLPKYMKPIKRKGLIIHWVNNPNTSAIANRNFFDNRKYGDSGYGSGHYIIGLDGEVIQCLKDNETAYHCGSKTYTDWAIEKFGSYPNNCTLGIEFCHPDSSGKPDEKTLTSLIKLSAKLCLKYNIDPMSHIGTHNQIVGWKNCPKYYTDNPCEFEKLLVKINKELISLKGVRYGSWNFK